jgi:uncharacterized membrane protein
MAPQEKSAWIMLVLAIASWTTYLVLLIRRADGGSLASTPYEDLVLWTIGGSIVASFVLHAIAQVYTSEKPDQRDREIEGRSDRIGTAFLVVGGLAALALAMTEQPHFWIANALYLAFVLTAVLSSIARIGFYRGGVPGW